MLSLCRTHHAVSMLSISAAETSVVYKLTSACDLSYYAVSAPTLYLCSALQRCQTKAAARHSISAA